MFVQVALEGVALLALAGFLAWQADRTGRLGGPVGHERHDEDEAHLDGGLVFGVQREGLLVRGRESPQRGGLRAQRAVGRGGGYAARWDALDLLADPAWHQALLDAP